MIRPTLRVLCLLAAIVPGAIALAQDGPAVQTVILNPAQGALRGDRGGPQAEGNVTAEVAMSVAQSLASSGLEVRSTRDLDKAAGTGATGLDKWQEGALEYLTALGVPEELVNRGDTGADRDDASRALFANWLNARSGVRGMVTLRTSNNEGVVVYYAADGPLPEASRELASAIVASLPGARMEECGQCFSENRLTSVPSVTVDLGSTASNPTDQLAAAHGIAQGVKLLGGAKSPLGLNDAPLAAKGEMQSPAPGSTLSGATVTFQWAAGTDATNYWLMVGTWLGGNTIYSADQGTLTSASVGNIPTNGQKVYVRLWSYINNVWQSSDYEYRAYSAGGSTPVKAALTSPAAGSTLPGASATFQWSAGVSVSRYFLFVGTYPGGNSIFSQDMASNLQAAVSGLPVDGSQVFVRLWSYIDGVWQSNDYQYTAYGTVAPRKADMTAPAAGSALGGSSATFQWSAGVRVLRYFLHVGTWAGGNTLFSQDMNTSLSASVTGLPTDASTVYVRLWSYIDGAWVYNDYQYTASGVAPAPVKADITSPDSGSTLAGSSATFQWSAGSAVQRYWLFVGTSVGNNDVYGADQGTSKSVSVTGLPANGKSLYVRIWSYINGAWAYSDAQYKAAGSVQ